MIIIVDATVKIKGDSTDLDRKILNGRKGVSQVNSEADAMKQNIKDTARQGRQLTSLILSGLKQSTILQGLNIVQTNILTGIQIKNTLLQANVAFASGLAGNPLGFVQAGIFTSLAGAMGYNLISSQLLQAQNQRLQQHTENINRMRDIYG